LAGATVVVKDSDATTPDVTTTASATGAFSVDVSSLKAPFIVQATGTLNGESVVLVALVPSVSGNISNITNVTPLTNAVAVLVAPGGDVSALNTAATLLSTATAGRVGDATALLVNTLRTDPTLSAALGANFNPLTTAFTANGLGIDGILDRLEIVSSASAGVSITNLAAPVTSEGNAPAPVVLTSAQTATPATVPTLATSVSSGNLPTSAEMIALAKKYQDCLALPIAQRVTLDSAGLATAIGAACNYLPSDWKSGGRNALEGFARFTLSNEQLTGAKAGTPTVATVFSAPNYTGANEFKHPYCNTATCVQMRIPFTASSGKPFTSDWIVGKINGAWNFVGNQRPYNLFVEQRLNRKVAMNTAGATANPTSFFFKDRHEAAIRLGFDLTAGTTTNIAAVRWTGPGLPAAGVVEHRSLRCGTDERLTITNQEGLLSANNSSSRQLANNSGGNDFMASAANLDGSTLAMPTTTTNWSTNASPSNQDVRASALTTAIPAFSTYKAEVFYFANTSNVADEVIYVKNDTPYEPASAGASKSWPTLTASVATAFLTPTGSSAGAISSLAQNFSWTNPAGTYIGGGYLFAQNFISTTNGTGDAAASYGLRTRLDFRPVALGDSTAVGREFASVVSSASMSPDTSTVGANPNPRCTSTNLTPLETINGAYWEIGLNFRGPDRKLYPSINFWTN
jgi:hypothetical protein